MIMLDRAPIWSSMVITGSNKGGYLHRFYAGAWKSRDVVLVLSYLLVPNAGRCRAYLQ